MTRFRQKKKLGLSSLVGGRAGRYARVGRSAKQGGRRGNASASCCSTPWRVFFLSNLLVAIIVFASLVALGAVTMKRVNTTSQRNRVLGVLDTSQERLQTNFHVEEISTSLLEVQALLHMVQDGFPRTLQEIHEVALVVNSTTCHSS